MKKKRKETLINVGRGIVNKPNINRVAPKIAGLALSYELNSTEFRLLRAFSAPAINSLNPRDPLSKEGPLGCTVRAGGIIKKIMKNMEAKEFITEKRTEIKRWAPGGVRARGQTNVYQYIKSKWLLELLTNTYTPLSTTYGFIYSLNKNNWTIEIHGEISPTRVYSSVFSARALPTRA